MENKECSYSIIVGKTQFPQVISAKSKTNLIQEYKDAVIGQKRFLAWEVGCIEMSNVLGVFIY